MYLKILILVFFAGNHKKLRDETTQLSDMSSLKFEHTDNVLITTIVIPNEATLQ